jgi:hypothetical protein
MSNLLAGLVQGFAEGSKDAQKRKDEEELRNLQVKAFKSQLEAKSKLHELMGGSVNMGSPTDPTNADISMTPGKSITDLISDPQGQKLLLQSGTMTGDQLIKDPQAAANAGLLNAITKNFFPQSLSPQTPANAVPPFAPPAAPAQSAGMGGLDLSGIGVDPKGPNIHFGKNELDKPYTPSELQKLTDEKGRPAPIGTTPRMAMDKGFKAREDSLNSAESTRVNQANVAAKSIQEGLNIIAPNGKIDKAVVLQMAAPMGGIGRGRELNQQLGSAVSAQLLLVSGVAVNPDEYKRTVGFYIPQPLDLSTPGLAERKLKRLQNLMEGNLDMATLPASVRTRIETRRKEMKQPGSAKVVDFNSLPP